MAIRLVAKDFLPNSRDKELHYIALLRQPVAFILLFVSILFQFFTLPLISDRKIIDYEFSTGISGHQEDL